MSKKIAFIVTSQLKTRVIVDVDDDFNVDDINQENRDKILNAAKVNLTKQFYHHFNDNINSIVVDEEIPYVNNIDILINYIDKNALIDGNRKICFFKKNIQQEIKPTNIEYLYSLYTEEGKLYLDTICYGFLQTYLVDDYIADILINHMDNFVK